MPTFASCAIRYRLDASGPATFLVDCDDDGDGELRVYARGELGASVPRPRVSALLAEPGSRWVPASGDIVLDEAAAMPGGDPHGFDSGRAEHA